MTFLNPFVLLGLLAASIPILIHLFNFRKPKKVDFSTLAFLKELEKTAMQRVRIQEWLLLALRILAVCCLVLGFAQPILQGNATDAKFSKTLYGILLDNSLSMKLRNGNGAYLTQAKNIATELVSQSKKGDEFLLQTTASGGISQRALFKSKDALMKEIKVIEAQPDAKSLMSSVKRSLRQMETVGNRNKELYVMTDLQRSTFLDSLDALEKQEHTHIVLVPIGDTNPTNIAITDVQLESKIVEEGQPVRMTATLKNFSDKHLDNYSAQVYLEGVPVAQAVTTLLPQAEATVEFTVTPQRRGWLGGEVKIEGDTFEDDNKRYFVIQVPEKRRVLIVKGDGERSAYVDLALSPQLTEGRTVFQTTSISEGSLGATDLQNYDVVILVGPRTIAANETESLKRFVERGGGVLFFPSSAPTPTDYTALFSALGGGRFNGMNGQLGGKNVIAKFDRVELEHPLFDGMFDKADLATKQVESPDVRLMMQYAQVSGTEQPLIRLTNGQPFLQEIRNGKGTTFLFAVAPDPQWGDFPMRGIFVPLLYRAVYYLSSEHDSKQADGSGNEDEGIVVSGSEGTLPLRLVAADGAEFAPPQQSVYGGILIEVDGIVRKAGLYEVKQGDKSLRKVAVNANSRESDLARFTPEEAKVQVEQGAKSSVKLMNADGAVRQIREAIQETRFGAELWNVFLFAALILLVIEMVASMQWRKRQLAPTS